MTVVPVYRDNFRSLVRRNPRPTRPYPRRPPGPPPVYRRPAAAIRHKTKILVKTKKKMNQVPRNIGGESVSKTFAKCDKLNSTLRKLLPTFASNNYYVNGSGRVTQTPGKQTASYLYQDFNQPDYQAIFAQVPSLSNTTKIIVDTCSTELYLTNAAQGTVKIYLYESICRKDTNQVPSTLWSTGIIDTGAAAGSSNDVGVTPFTSSLFCEAQKIIKITKIILMGGMSHCHRLSHINRRMVSDEYVNGQLASSVTQYKGHTISMMMVAHGMPCNDATTKTQVTTGEVAIDYVFKKCYTYKVNALEKAVSNVYTNNLPSAFTVSESIVQPESGLVVPSEGVA